jgi:hypothetical protein
LIAQRRIGPRQLGQDVIGVAILFEKPGLDVDAQLHGNLSFDHARDHVVVLAGEHDHREGIRRVVAAGLHEHGAVHAAARLDEHGGAARGHRLGDGLPPACRASSRSLVAARAALAAAGGALPGADGLWLGDRRVRLERRLDPVGRDEVGDCCRLEQRRALQLWAHRRNVVCGPAHDGHHRHRDFARGGGAPRFGIPEQRHVTRLDHLDRELVQRPAATELPRLEARVGEAPLRHGVARPLGGALVLGRAGEARADAVRQHREERAGLGPVERLVADLRDRGAIDRLGRLSRVEAPARAREHEPAQHGEGGRSLDRS